MVGVGPAAGSSGSGVGAADEPSAAGGPLVVAVEGGDLGAGAVAALGSEAAVDGGSRGGEPQGSCDFWSPMSSSQYVVGGRRSIHPCGRRPEARRRGLPRWLGPCGIAPGEVIGSATNHVILEGRARGCVHVHRQAAEPAFTPSDRPRCRGQPLGRHSMPLMRADAGIAPHAAARQGRERRPQRGRAAAHAGIELRDIQKNRCGAVLERGGLRQ